MRNFELSTKMFIHLGKKMECSCQGYVKVHKFGGLIFVYENILDDKVISQCYVTILHYFFSTCYITTNVLQ
jgi:hypothetical protein